MNEGKKQIVSNNILFESEIFSKEGRGVLPFKIVVEEEKKGDIRSVVVRQIVYKPIIDHAVIDEKLLLSSFWKESDY